ncbi:uncharacterized protein LOC131663990 [Phymastichus coffea]|uniref:uncharacterized protein LOC131663990 n=1 Tax=Phymastichus coffea TaxID=108790 RepID=UPI00273A8BE4|nr:uncharacterized protein LOC131663990 [Phymastichus coffea]
MTEREAERHYDKYKSGIVFLLTVSGIWPDVKPSPRTKVATRCLTLLALFAELAVTFGTVNFCLQNLTNVGALAMGLGPMICFSSAFFKTLVMLIRREDVIRLNRRLSDRFERDMEIMENRPLLLAHYPSFQRYFRLHYYYTGAIILLAIISPILALRHGKYIRAYPQLLFFAYEPDTNHKISYEKLKLNTNSIAI